jgi:hypothetical protein
VKREPLSTRCPARLPTRVAEAADHGRHLGVEHRVRQPARQVVEDFHVLAGGVEHLQDLFVLHQPEQRAQVHARGHGVHRLRLVRAGQLHQAQDGPVGAFAHELGIDGDVAGGGEAPAQVLEGLRVGDHRHGRGINGIGRPGKAGRFFPVGCHPLRRRNSN